MLSLSEAEKLLNYEANLLDERNFEEWLSLFSEDGIYWIPIREEKTGDEAVSIIYDNDLRRRERVYRITQTQIPAQTPPSRTLHFITGIRIEKQDENEVIIHSNQLVYEMRYGNHYQAGIGEQRSFAGKYIHCFRKDNGNWKIALKKIHLINRDTPISNFSFII